MEKVSRRPLYLNYLSHGLLRMLGKTTASFYQEKLLIETILKFNLFKLFAEVAKSFYLTSSSKISRAKTRFL